MSVANYVCQSGYELIGVQQRTCQHTGNWSEEPPMCLRKRVDNIFQCNGMFSTLASSYYIQMYISNNTMDGNHILFDLY